MSPFIAPRLGTKTVEAIWTETAQSHTKSASSDGPSEESESLRPLTHEEIVRLVRSEQDRRQKPRETSERRQAAADGVDTAHTHDYAVSGCRYQWALDHDHADCWRNFMIHQGQPADTTYAEFYGETSPSRQATVRTAKETLTLEEYRDRVGARTFDPNGKWCEGTGDVPLRSGGMNVAGGCPQCYEKNPELSDGGTIKAHNPQMLRD